MPRFALSLLGCIALLMTFVGRASAGPCEEFRKAMLDWEVKTGKKSRMTIYARLSCEEGLPSVVSLMNSLPQELRDKSDAAPFTVSWKAHGGTFGKMAPHVDLLKSAMSLSEGSGPGLGAKGPVANFLTLQTLTRLVKYRAEALVEMNQTELAVRELAAAWQMGETFRQVGFQESNQLQFLLGTAFSTIALKQVGHMVLMGRTTGKQRDDLIAFLKREPDLDADKVASALGIPPAEQWRILVPTVYSRQLIIAGQIAKANKSVSVEAVNKLLKDAGPLGLDPFTNKPFHVEVTERKLVNLRSVGPDGKLDPGGPAVRVENGKPQAGDYFVIIGALGAGQCGW